MPRQTTYGAWAASLIPPVCECPDGCPAPYYRNVVYGGPCPPSPDDPCQPPLPPPPIDPPCYRPYPDLFAHAYFAQTGTLSAAEAGDPVAVYAIQQTSPNSFTNEGGIIGILRPGLYQATLAITLPQGSVIDTQLEMQLDEQTLPGTLVTLKSTGAAGVTAYVQTIFRALEYGATLQIASSQPFSVTGGEGEILASLILTQIGPAALG